MRIALSYLNAQLRPRRPEASLEDWVANRFGYRLYRQDETPFSGGSGTLPSGAMAPTTALIFGLACAGVGLAVGLWFLVAIGRAFLPILAVGAVCVLAYTDVLARLGIGEVAAGIGLGALPVVGAALVQDGSFSPASAAAAIPASEWATVSPRTESLILMIRSRLMV